MDEQEFPFHQNHAYFTGKFAEVYVMELYYRIATANDIPSLAGLRSLAWGEVDYWIPRITGYLNGMSDPQQSLPRRVIYVEVDGDAIVAFIAGHLTKRLECDGELEWIDVDTEYRRKGIASELIKVLAKWFVQQNARKICVDPGNEDARKLYAANGAENLNQHWMYWKDIAALL
jgi:GNAT superfamily N-acetyltransferase